MRLADFILANGEPILAEWECFARSIWPRDDTNVDPAELRDHADDILRATARDMQSPQTAGEQTAKSKGNGDGGKNGQRMLKASAMHASDRVSAGFGLMALVSEYRALRASVLRLWRDSGPQPDLRNLDDLTRFNESIDQSITEAVRSYTQRVAQSRQMFLAILGHDLRNPLNSMLLTGKMIAHAGQLDATLTELASQIPVSAAAMSKLIDDLLDFTGTELSGALSVSPEPMDLGELCDEVVHETRSAHPDCDIHLERQGDLTGTWDATRLRQLLSNLLGNAIQHGGATSRIDLNVIDQGPGVKLTVHNQGPPIPHENLATIFEPMVRGPQAQPKHGSMGLGLYIARAVVIGHGGEIDVASSRSAGTVFTVRLPRKHVKA